MALLACENVCFAYEGNTVVSEVNFAVQSGDYLCVVGENGSGKSTLIKGLLGLKQPHRGRIISGEGLSRREIGYLPQQTALQQDFPASVFEVVLSGRLGRRGLSPFYTRADKAMAEQQLARLELTGLRNKCYRELSGGQQQRVLLARALCAAHRLLLLDEPVSGLDPLITQELYELIAQLHRESGLTVIMVSHDLHYGVKYADHILHLKNHQAFFGPTGEYLQSNLGQSFLGGGSG